MKNILIIEDNHIVATDISDALVGYFGDNNIDVFCICDNIGSINLEKIKSYSPDLVILDINLGRNKSKISGIEIAEIIKNGFANNVPIIVASVLNSVESSALLSKGLSDAFILKPFSQEDICRAVNSFLKLK